MMKAKNVITNKPMPQNQKIETINNGPLGAN